MHIRPWGHRLVAGLGVLALVLAACTGSAPGSDLGPDPRQTQPTDPTSDQGASITTTLPRPDGVEFQNTVVDACPDGPGGEMVAGNARVEMAFLAQVFAIDNTDAAPWVAFSVDRWFTDDLGTQIGLWAPDFEGLVGEDWLISSTRYGLVTGDVIACASETTSPDAFDQWEAAFGGSVLAGAGTTEREADPAIIAQINEAQARWQSLALTTWTAMITFEPRLTAGSATCGGSIRVVMRDGEIVQAVNPDSGCVVPLGRAPTIDRIFLEARRAAGAIIGEITYDPDLGLITGMYASDRSVEVSLGVSGFLARALPLAVEPEEHEQARDAWEASGIRDYLATLTIECFCAITGTFDIEVMDGEVSSMTRREEPGGFGGGGGMAPDPASLTIDGLFDQIDEARSTGTVQVGYEPEAGWPVTVFLDPVINAIDDETRYRVDSVTPA